MNFKQKLFTKIINENNNIPIDEFINYCLYDEGGYYQKKNIIGSNGDFITSPEISQLFGEILGLYIYNTWKKNINSFFNLIELGPGNGTLLSDILRITNTFNDFNKSMMIHLIEINKYMIQLQKNTLKKMNVTNNKVKWHDDFIDIDGNPSIIFANEFFDCFPIKQFIIKNNQWYEKKISVNYSTNKLTIFNDPISNKKIINNLNKNIEIYKYKENQVIEISYQREAYFNKICKHIKKNSGIIIIFDYGYNSSLNYSSLQTVINHRYSHIFDDPGSHDISSLVNFKNFREIAKANKLEYINFFTQKKFLLLNGIRQRKDKLKLNNKKEGENIDNDYTRLTSEKQMGKIFKCFIASNRKINE